ncbi:MAG: hypothetical protein LBT20_00710 [Clostridiales bacterium]|jgi:hypothetical protein|nr:hypothetical protein [Clostridiales bacterium]
MKNAKLYTSLYKYFSSDCASDLTESFFADLIQIDFGTAAEIYEFLLTLKESRLNDGAFGKEFTEPALGVFLKANRTKTLELLKTNQAIAKRVFSISAAALTATTYKLLFDLIVGSKFDDAAYFVDLLLKNPNKSSVDDRFEELFEGIFIRYKTADGKIDIPKRNAAFLISTAEKIKGGKGVLLIQKVKVLI